MPNSDDASPPDYYARLGVRPTASAEEIRRAYRQKARETHPDRNPNDPRATERFRKVKEAYRVLRDPERRTQYDDVRAAGRRVPDALTITQQAPAGCGGYLWRVFAGLVAVGLFFVLEAAGVWAAADAWTITIAVGVTSLLAGLIAMAVARQFPDEATDVSMRLNGTGLTLWADGHAALQVGWERVRAVRLLDDWSLEMDVERTVVEGLRPAPPVLVAVDARSDHGRLCLDLSETDAPRDALLLFLRGTDAVPFPAREERHASDAA
ncbi:MAG: J domain-containing protein [Salinivenus sp.]